MPVRERVNGGDARGSVAMYLVAVGWFYRMAAGGTHLLWDLTGPRW